MSRGRAERSVNWTVLFSVPPVRLTVRASARVPHRRTPPPSGPFTILRLPGPAPLTAAGRSYPHPERSCRQWAPRRSTAESPNSASGEWFRSGAGPAAPDPAPARSHSVVTRRLTPPASSDRGPSLAALAEDGATSREAREWQSMVEFLRPVEARFSVEQGRRGVSPVRPCLRGQRAFPLIRFPRRPGRSAAAPRGNTRPASAMGKRSARADRRPLPAMARSRL
jgi:hypothetical protein